MNDPAPFFMDSHTADYQLSKSSPSRMSSMLAYKKLMMRQDQFPSSPPSQPSKPPSLGHVPCKFFKQGTCTAGANCTFSHNLDPYSETAVCRYYLKGKCKFGNKCALLHSMAPSTNHSHRTVDQRYQSPQRSSFYLPSMDHRHSSPSNNSTASSFLSPPSSRSLHAPAPARHPPQTSASPAAADDLSYEMNDAMLPSSLNDLLTPSELQLRRAREHHERMMDYATSPPQQLLQHSHYPIASSSSSPPYHASSNNPVQQHMPAMSSSPISSHRYLSSASAATTLPFGRSVPTPIAMPTQPNSLSMLPSSPPVSSWPWIFDDDPLLQSYQQRQRQSAVLSNSVNSNSGHVTLPPNSQQRMASHPATYLPSSFPPTDSTATPASDPEPFDLTDDDTQLFFMDEIASSDRHSPATPKSPTTASFIFPSLTKKPQPFM
ncbi:hypothetical protein DM01DRAFT_1307207 [Hesseltinella vesiculosa]|uniref:C3H1-type domain-containing protein n=1 Tax=Hesseltinella vesiculosa TaxID=101127 RepID=A0A1X2GER6_9FUNG|nr:hypothetical protein DM01DRAFT_1307207 [Hesseltinella vesiculosa]